MESQTSDSMLLLLQVLELHEHGELISQVMQLLLLMEYIPMVLTQILHG